jgi:hypothetical protein
MEIEKLLEEENNSMVISYMTIRKVLGILGLLLPVIMVVGTLLFGDCSEIERSMSAYYYTVAGHVFIAIICAFALFLFTYKGKQKIDTVASNIAGMCALGIAFFPTTYGILRTDCIVLITESSSLISFIHFASAALFFIILALMSLFLFTKSNSPKPTKEKRLRNFIYKICGWAMLISITLIAVYELFLSNNSTIVSLKPVFILETLALWAFGFSWLVKGEFIFKDKPQLKSKTS